MNGETKLNLPKFESDIPSELMKESLTAKDLWIVKELSVGKQRMEWIALRLAENYELASRIDKNVSAIDSRLSAVEKWQLVFTSKKTIVVALVLIILNAVLFPLLVRYFMNN